MNNKEILLDLTRRVRETIRVGVYATWDDLYVEMKVRDPSRPFDGIVVRGEENDNGDQYFSVSLRNGFTKNDSGTEIVKRFSDSFSMEDLEKTIIDALLGAELYRSNQPDPEREDLKDRFLRINGKVFSFDKVAKALGIQNQINAELVQVELCQRVDSGILVATPSSFDHDDYPGIDLALHLPAEQGTLPIMISRTEQPRPEGESHALRTFGYSREDEYFMYFDSDLRPDAQVDTAPSTPALTVSGGQCYCVDVRCENPYVNYKGYSPPSLKESLESKIQFAASRFAEGLSSEREQQNEHSR